MLGITDRAAALAQLPLKLHSAEGCARTIADGIERNRAIITYTGAACAMWALYRLSPLRRRPGTDPLTAVLVIHCGLRETEGKLAPQCQVGGTVREREGTQSGRHGGSP